MGQCVGSKLSTQAVAGKKAMAADAHRKQRRSYASATGDAAGVAEAAPSEQLPSAVEPTGEEDEQRRHANAPATAAADVRAMAAVSAAVSGGDSGHGDQSVALADQPAFESMLNRVDKGDAYSWLNFSHSNSHLTAKPLVRSRWPLASLPPPPHAPQTRESGNGGNGGGGVRGDRIRGVSSHSLETLRCTVGDRRDTHVRVRSHVELAKNNTIAFSQEPALPVAATDPTGLSKASDVAGTPSLNAGARVGIDYRGPGSGAETVFTSRPACSIDAYSASDLRPGSVLVRRPGQVSGRRFTVQSSSQATILLLDICGSVVISHCEHCFLFIGPTVGTIEVEDCRACVLIAACGQLRLKRCTRMILSVLTTAMPTLEASYSIGLTPLSGWFAYNEMPLHLQAAHLSPFINNYSTVRDLTPQPVGAGAGAGAAAAALPQRKRNFFYLDPWDFDVMVWRCAVATALHERRYRTDVGLANLSATAAPVRRTLASGDATSSLNTVPSSEPDAERTKCRKREKGGTGSSDQGDEDEEVDALDGSTSDTGTGTDRPLLPAISAANSRVIDRGGGSTRLGISIPLGNRTNRHDGNSGNGAGGSSLPLSSSLVEVSEKEDADEVQQVMTSTPVRLLGLPIVFAKDTDTASANDGREGATGATGAPNGARKTNGKSGGVGRSGKRQASPQRTAAAGVNIKPVALPLPPLRPRSVEDVFSLYTNAMVSPASFGAGRIPRCFFTERWRLKLFVVTNKHGGWGIANRVARDIELARRQWVVEYVRTVPAAGRGGGDWSRPSGALKGVGPAKDADATQAISKPGEGTSDEVLYPHWQPRQAGQLSAEEAPADAQQLYEHHKLSLSQRCGPVLLLNAVELRCTPTVMREYVVPTFYKLTEPKEVEEARRRLQQEQQQREAGPHVYEHGHKQDKVGTDGGKSGLASAPPTLLSKSGGSGHKSAEQRAREAEDLARSIEIRRMFGDAIQRMSGQACVFFLALVAPPDVNTGVASPQRRSGGGNTIDGGASRDNNTGDGSYNDSSHNHHHHHHHHGEVDDDNAVAVSQYAARRDRKRKELGEQRNAANAGALEHQEERRRRSHHRAYMNRQEACRARTRARRLDGMRVFQPLSQEEEDDDENAEPNTDDDEVVLLAAIGDGHHSCQQYRDRRSARNSASDDSSSGCCRNSDSNRDGVRSKGCNVTSAGEEGGINNMDTSDEDEGDLMSKRKAAADRCAERRESHPGGGITPSEGVSHEELANKARGYRQMELVSVLKKARRINGSGGDGNGNAGKSAAIAGDDVELAQSREERAWPRAVLLNVSVPLRFVSLLQSNIFFRASILSTRTSGGKATPS